MSFVSGAQQAWNNLVVPLVVPNASKSKMSPALAQDPQHLGQIHLLNKMNRYKCNLAFLSGVAIALISRIALSRTADGLAHNVAKYGVKSGCAFAASIAVFASIVYVRAFYTDQAKYGVVPALGSTVHVKRGNPWF